MKAHLELCEIADRVMKQPGGGPALLFEHVVLRDGIALALSASAINLFGSMRAWRWRSACDELDDIGDRITKLLDLKVPDGLLGKLSLLPRLLEVAKFPPRMQRARRRARRSCGAATRST